ncbi:PAS domain S-box protein [Methylobacterium soli]|uniref:Blue-light-activated histidine kinase n=1 Tax=Methylobacterium soli TaxID=553447 RepID=A0A6L3SS42_9HYPH|nr:PAS domain S-box protein [Methylobacterium soli]GJE41874.1 Blue-light-activated histidine kinase 1 [Methylobacterium soli]
MFGGDSGVVPPADADPSPAVDLKLLQAAIEATNEAILITSTELDEPGPRIEYANPAFTRMSGYTLKDVIGRTPRLLQGPQTERAVLDRMRKALIAGEAFQGEATNYRKDGSTYFVEWLITPVRGPDGSVSHWISAQRDITDRRAAEDRQILMVRELHHRVKNTLATVQAVLNATVRSAVSIPDFARMLTGRITSLAKTHAMITEDLAQAVLFRQLVASELQAYDDRQDGRLSLEGPQVVLPSELAVPIGMALHELTINAIKHGALAHADGRIEVTWSLEQGTSGQQLRWIWNEHDGPPVALPTRDGFGSRVLNRVLTAQIGAEVNIDYDPDGLRVTVDVPLGQGR